jgi:hypothetical protein
MEDLLDAIVEYLLNQPEIVLMTEDDSANGDFHIGAYTADIPQVLPFLSVRFGPSRPISDSNMGYEKTLVNLTAHSTNPTISSKIVDLLKNLIFPSEIRGYMNISNDRIANPSTMYKRRWQGVKADKPYDKDSDVWMDMIEIEVIWSGRSCRSNPYDLPVAEFPDAQDDRPTC